MNGFYVAICNLSAGGRYFRLLVYKYFHRSKQVLRAALTVVTAISISFYLDLSSILNATMMSSYFSMGVSTTIASSVAV